MHIKSEKENVRIDQYLTEELDISRSKVQKLIKDEKVSVNGKIITNNYKVKLDDEIEVDDELDFEINIKTPQFPIGSCGVTLS